MKFVRHLARFLCSMVILIIGVCAAVALCIVFFILAGKLIPGEVMFDGGRTPTVAGALTFAFIGFAIVAALGIARKTLLPKAST